jgi:hypothetical protein
MVEGQMTTVGITEWVVDMIVEECRNTIVESMFVPCE